MSHTVRCVNYIIKHSVLADVGFFVNLSKMSIACSLGQQNCRELALLDHVLLPVLVK